MQTNPLGTTDLIVSRLGFGCGSMGGLLVRGEYPAMRQAIARAIELGITYFDTASIYGNGQSEVNLGAIVRELDAKPEIVIGSKVRITRPEQLDDLRQSVVDSVEASLRRMGREQIDLIQFHNRIGPQRDLDQSQVAVSDLGEIFAAFDLLKRQGKVRYWGITGLGETHAIQTVVNSGGFHSSQICYNMLNPSAGQPVPDDFPYQNYDQLIDRCAANGIGTIVIRMLAGGALSGVTERHPVASKSVNPIGSEETYVEDVERVQSFKSLVDEGHVENLVEAAIRFVLGKPEVSTALVGISTLEQLEMAVHYAAKGPLSLA
ncbi:MAG: aldo/keto reductase [Chloroflexota bacterium]